MESEITSHLTTSELDDIRRAVECIHSGGVIVYPTDTIWGIGCDATNSEAIKKVYALKGRISSKAVISLVGDIAGLKTIVGNYYDLVSGMIAESDRPLTVIYPSVNGVSGEVVAEDGSAAVRLTQESFSATLCIAAGVPLVSTSANFSGEIAPRCFDEICPELLSGADYVCMSHRIRPADLSDVSASRIVRLLADGNIEVIRP